MIQRTCLRRLVVTLMVVIGSAATAQADIFQWEYINPADPSQGKQQTTLAPDGAGVDAAPGADIAGRNLTMAYLIGTNLTDANASFADLTNADLSYSELTNASFSGATLTDADFTGAQVHVAHFDKQYLYSCSFYCFDFRMGTGITPAQLYPTASYQAGDLSGIGFAYNDLAGGNFTGQNLANASFYGATLTNADFTGAEVRGTSFAIDGHFGGTGVSAAQLRSTASYQNHDLSGIDLHLNDLVDANFVGQNLNNANFTSAVLTDTDFTAAEILEANFSREWTYLGPLGTGIALAQLYSTATYERRDLSGIDFSRNHFAGANFAGQNLTNVDFTAAYLLGADFSGAEIRGAKFDRFCHPFVCDGSGITPAQLYSTASYQAQNLSGISFLYHTLEGVNLAGQNLTNTSYGYYLRYGDIYDMRLTGANLNGADARGASGLCDYKQCTGAVTHNLIWPNGYINGLDLNAGGLLVVRDYDSPSNDPEFFIPITVDQHLAMGPGGTLRIVFEADEWDSTISFAPGIPVALGGTLELSFAADVNLASQVGRTFDLFDWTGVNPTGAFAVASPYVWNLSNLYSTGEVTLTAIPEPSALLLLSLCLAAFLPMRCVVLRNRSCALQIVAASFSLLAFASVAQANIFQWEYINPADPSQGKRQSTTLAPDGAGVDAVPGANLFNRNLTIAYLIGADLTGSYGQYANLTNADLSQANLTNASFGAANLTGASFRHANLSNASFQFVRGRVCGFDGSCFLVYDYATLTNSDLTGSDARGALGLQGHAATANLIRPNGHINGFHLDVGGLLVVRDYRNYFGTPTPFPIIVDEHLAMGPGGRLRMVFEADEWDSTISFAPGIPVTLGGTLELTFADDVNLANQVGRTFDLFDWTGVDPTDTFAVAGPYAWDLSYLYATGEVTLTAVPEPGTLVLFSLALSALVAMGRARIDLSKGENQ